MNGVEFIEVDGLKIRLQRNKVGGGIPVVLTSPWPESLFAYQRIWPILGAEASLIAVDIPGFGQSEGRPQLMSPRAMGDFIPKILAALGLDRVHAVGPDVGTSALLFAANAHSDLFESLVVGSGATDAALTAGALKDFINAQSTASFEGRSGEVFATGAIDLMMKTKPDPQALKDYQASSAGRRFIEAMAYVRAYPIDLPSLRAALPGIRTPVLSIWGARDPIVPPENAEVLDRGLAQNALRPARERPLRLGGTCGRLRGGDPGLDPGRLQSRLATAYAVSRSGSRRAASQRRLALDASVLLRGSRSASIGRLSTFWEDRQTRWAFNRWWAFYTKIRIAYVWRWPSPFRVRGGGAVTGWYSRCPFSCGRTVAHPNPS